LGHNRPSFERKNRRLCRLATGVAVALACLLTGATTEAAARTLPPIRTSLANAVPACVTPDKLMQFTQSRNRDIPTVLRQLARTYRVVGNAYGVRWDMAFFQMLVETNDLRFRTSRGGPLSIQPEHFNFGGLSGSGESSGGERFASLTLGVQAHIEHTLVYAGRRIVSPIAERTRKLIAWRVLDEWQSGFDRPITFTDMALRWNPFREAYADEVLERATSYYARHCPGVQNFGFRPAAIEARQRTALSSTQIASAWTSSAAPAGSQQVDEPFTSDAATIRPPKPRLAQAPGKQAEEPPAPARKPATRAKPKTAPTRLASLAPQPPPRGDERPRITDAAPTPPRTKPARTAAPKKRPSKPKPPTADDRIRQLVSGRLVHLTADFGAVIPVLFRTNGTMRGQAGNLAFFLGAAEDNGKWWVDKGLLCKKWTTWFKGNEVCLTLKQRGRTVHWRSRDGRSGTAKIVR
jgi:hypothetical protein